MSCSEFEKWIALDVSGDLPAGSAAQVRAHLRQCRACRDFARELSADLEWLQSAHQQPPDPAALHQIRVGVMRRLESGQNRRDRPLGGLTAFGWRWQWIVTAAAVAVVLGSLAWWNTSHKLPQGTLAAGSQNRTQRPETQNAPAARPPESGLAKADSPERINESPGGAIPSPWAVHEPDSSPLRGAETNPAQNDGRSPEAQQDRVAAPQIASLAPRETRPVRKPQPSFERLDRERKLEIVTARLAEPQQAPQEAVMLKIPTSNPNVVVYWLMDEEQQPEKIEENEGD